MHDDPGRRASAKRIRLCIAAALIAIGAGWLLGLGSSADAADPARPYLGMSKEEILACAGEPHARYKSGADKETLTYHYSGAGPVPAAPGEKKKKDKPSFSFGGDKGKKKDKDKKAKKAKKGDATPTGPVSVVVTYAEIVRGQGGEVTRVAIDDLTSITVEVSRDRDLRWVLGHDGGELVVPASADGADELVGRLERFEGFDQDAPVQAAASSGGAPSVLREAEALRPARAGRDATRQIDDQGDNNRGDAAGEGVGAAGRWPAAGALSGGRPRGGRSIG